MKTVIGNKEKAWVVFMPHDEVKETCFQKVFYWFLNRMKKNFSHVAVFRKSAIDGWVVGVDCCSDNLIIHEMGYKQFFNFISKPEITCICVDVKPGKIKATGLITCVSVAKHYLGVDGWSIITPYQLFKYLEKNK